MRILQVFNQYRYRGGEEAWVDAIPRLLAGVSEVEEVRFQSIEWMGKNAPSQLEQVKLIANNPTSRKVLRDKAEDFSPDVLLIHNVIPVISFGIYDEAVNLGIPIIQYIHNFRPFSPGGTLWAGTKVNDAALRGNPWPEILAGGWQGSTVKTAVLAWHLRNAMNAGTFNKINRWIAPSAFMRDKFVGAGIEASKISVLPHCLVESPKVLNTPDEGEHYLYLGRLERDKGVELLIEAWLEFAKNTTNPLPKLVIAGTGTLQPYVERIAAKESSIAYLGFVDGNQKLELVATCRAMVVPSICWESLGLTAYEAFAASCPVIAARAGALNESVKDGITGWTHEAGNMHQLAKLFQDVESAGIWERRKRGHAGNDWLMNNAQPGKWRGEFLEICEGVVRDYRENGEKRREVAKRGSQNGKVRAGGGNEPCQSVYVCVYLGDQNPGVGRSLGISRMTEAVLRELSERNDIRLHVLASRTSQMGPEKVFSRKILPWGTKNTTLRVFTDHTHPLGPLLEKPDIYYYPKGFLPLTSRFVRPSVVTIHDTIIDHYRRNYPSWRKSFEYSYWAAMLRHTLKSADSVMTVSEAAKVQILEFMKRQGIPEKEIIVTHEPCLYEAIPQPRNPRKGSYVIHLSSREPHKRTAQLVRWWLQGNPKSRPKLKLIGSVPPEVTEIVASCQYLEILPFLKDEDLQSEIKGALALLFPSEIEGFGLPALEAYYLGTPVCYVAGTSVEEVLKVATPLGGFSLNSADSMYAALEEVMQMSQDEVYRCGIILRETYSAKKTAEIMMRVFRKIAAHGA